MAQRPVSGSSTRSRRDEVWEMKRQRFIARKQGEMVGAGPVGRPRPAVLGQEALQAAPVSHSAAPAQAAPASPLSQLVARGGYQQPQQPAGSVRQPYGERPSSGSAAVGFLPQHPVSRGSHQDQAGAFGGGGAYSGGGFDANVAGQWSANVQQTRHNQQNRHDPSVAGPVMPSGGQRITQAPGGGSNIDLSWGGPPPAQQPPRLPGSTPSSGGGGNYRQQAYDSDPRAAAGSGFRGAGGQFAAPWGREDDYLPSRQPQARRETCPFGTDGGAVPSQRALPSQVAGQRTPGAAASPAHGLAAGQRPCVPQAALRSGSRGPPPDAAPGPFGGEAPAAGVGRRRPPGGMSQVVLG